MSNKQPPAWMTGTVTPKAPEPPLNHNLPPAWHVGGAPPVPGPEAPDPGVVSSIPSTGPMAPPPPDPSDPLPLPPLPGQAVPVPIPVVYTPPVVPPSVTLPPEATQPTVVPPPSAAFDWRPAVIAALREVGNATANSQFATWAAAPADVITLALSESSGDLRMVMPNGYSSKLGRESYKMGLFGMNEIWCPGHFRDAPGKIGNANAAKMLPFPQSNSWTKADAERVLLAWPAQIWYAMVLLRYFSLFKNTYFASVDSFPGGKIVATTVASRTKERPLAIEVAQRVGSIAASLKTPPSLVLMKAFWLASSPEGVRGIVKEGVDARIASAAQWYPGLASVPNKPPNLIQT